jgi:ABC-type nitrate/sulfonate/bicarbonate transport system substrate-binding protein
MMSATRRSFLAGSAALVLGAAPRDFGPLTFQLPWIKNVEWSGEYLADARGYYRAAGFTSVNLLGGGPGAPPVETLVSAGRAFASISSPATTAAAILAGAAVTSIGVQYQTSPYIIASLAERPLRTPREMIGKRIGIPGGNELTWSAFLRVNHLDSATVETVPVGTTAAPLANRQVDGLLAFVTNVPYALRSHGIATHWFALGDFGYRLVNNNYIVATESIRTQREMVKALLRAEIHGWKASLQSPDLSVRMTVETYGRDLGLTLDDQRAQFAAQRGLMISPQTRTGGLFSMTPADVTRSIELLRASGIEIAAERLFDLSLLDEVYAADRSLR